MILLDTHALVWWLEDPSKLSQKAFESIQEAIKQETLFISSISFWEIALLYQKDRLKLNQPLLPWVSYIKQLKLLSIISVEADIALSSVLLPPPLHNDPADRIIAATAQSQHLTLVTKDMKLRKYPHIATIW